MVMKDVNMHEEIAKVASGLYEKSGRVGGCDLDNWLKAEKIVMTRYREQEKTVTEKPAAKKKATTKRSTIKKG
jgi:hypothetical protein